MPAFETAVRQDLFAAIETILPSLTQIYDAKDINRINWRDFIQQFQEQGPGAGIEPPYVVVAWGKQVPANGKYGGSNSAFDWPVYVFVIVDATGPSDEWEEALTDLADALRRELLGHDSLQTPEVAVDYSGDTPPNMAFLKYGMALWSAMVSFSLICGEAGI